MAVQLFWNLVWCAASQYKCSFFSSHVGTFANKYVVLLLQEYDSDETMNVLQEEQKADKAAKTSIVKVHYGTSTVLEDSLGLHLVISNATARPSF